MLKRILIFLFILAVPAAALAIKYKGDLETKESVTLPEQSSTPSSPASGKHKLYIKSDGAAYTLDSSGNENTVGSRVAAATNYLINGGFRIWQRGTSFTTPSSPSYVADRWKLNYGGTIGTFTVSRQAFTLGQTDVPGEPEFFLRWDHTAAGSGQGSNVLRQIIEGVRTLAGEKVTVSFWGKADSARTVSTSFTQTFGSGGTPSADVVGAGKAHSFTASWQKFTHTFTLASISGKALGANNNDGLIFQFLLPINTTKTIDIARVQVEQGSEATTFEHRPIGLELQMAQRYFCKSYDLETAPGTATTDGSLGLRLSGLGTVQHSMSFSIPHPVRMRAPPAITTYAPDGTSDKWGTNGGNRAATLLSSGNRGFTVDVPHPTTSNAYVLGHYTADAEF